MFEFWFKNTAQYWGCILRITNCMFSLSCAFLSPRVRPCVLFGRSARRSRFVINWVCSTRSTTDRRTETRTAATPRSQVHQHTQAQSCWPCLASISMQLTYNVIHPLLLLNWFPQVLTSLPRDQYGDKMTVLTAVKCRAFSRKARA